MVNLADTNAPKPDEPDEVVEPDAKTEAEFVTPEEAAKTDSPESTEPEKTEEPTKDISPKEPTAAGGNKFKRFFAGYWAKKKWAIPVTILALLAVLFAVPFTSYAILGLFVKSQVNVTVVDSKTGKAVSSANVSLKGQAFKTNASGVAVGKVSVGGGTLNVTKQYYTSVTKDVTVTLSKTKNSFKVSLAATGRQVPIKALNKVTGKPLAGVTIKVLKTEAKTDKNGLATIVLPTAKPTQPATLSLGGYNTLSGQVQVTDQVVASNTFSLEPSGKLYFLSNKSGKIDVVKTNLDGTGREVVLAGTGHEDPNTTSLLASKDWKYLALLARRAGTSASLYLIDTSSDKQTTIDEGDADFTLVGWSGDTFAYTISRNNKQAWEAKQTAIKTFNAPTQKLSTIYENDASGDANNYIAEGLGWTQQLGSKLVWFTAWSSHHQYGGVSPELNGKQAQVVEYDVDKASKKVIKTYTISGAEVGYYYYTNPISSYGSVVYAPGEIYFSVSGPNDTKTNSEYEDGAVTDNSTSAKAYFDNNAQEYPTYLESPSGKLTLWSDQRDGKNALFTGDNAGKNEKQIATLSEYSQYGWYSDDYLLVSKNASELYILPVDGSSAPQKITDYYKPPVSYRGYGGGYGGI